MKKITLLFLIFFAGNVLAQFKSMKSDEGLLAGGLGVTWIDGKPHYAFHLFPEFAFANFGIGLDLSLEYTGEGKLRTENFNEFSDYLSIIRYVRYGQKNDPVYARLGALDYATLGHGSIMYLYNNTPTYDARRIGLEFDLDFNSFGFESVYGNFGQSGVIGLRGYVHPLHFTELASVPILGNMEIGATVVSDLDPNSGILTVKQEAGGSKFINDKDEGRTTVIGFDIGFPIIRSGLVSLDIYADYSKILSFGNGVATGFVFGLNGLGLVNIRTKFERRFNNDKYLPAYFNSLYEIERYRLDENSGEFSSKAALLSSIGSAGNGWYGELLVSLLGTFDVLGSYQRLDKFPKSGLLHISSEVAPDGIPFIARAGYDKINIQSEKDIFTLDDRSHLFAELGYKPYPYLIVSMVYHWTFTPLRDAGDNIIGYKPQKKIEPRVSFVYPIQF